MVKEPKNIDFTTTGRQPSAEEFALISEWIKAKKEKAKKPRTSVKQKSRIAK